MSTDITKDLQRIQNKAEVTVKLSFIKQIAARVRELQRDLIAANEKTADVTKANGKLIKAVSLSTKENKTNRMKRDLREEYENDIFGSTKEAKISLLRELEAEYHRHYPTRHLVMVVRPDKFNAIRQSSSSKTTVATPDALKNPSNFYDSAAVVIDDEVWRNIEYTQLQQLRELMRKTRVNKWYADRYDRF